MSLLEKLGQKRTQKDQLQQEKVLNEKKQSFEQINNQVIATEAKKQRIIELSKSLQTNYQGGEKKLADFKNQKEELKKAYEEHKDILEEEGIENFEEMLEANAKEPEVKRYRRAGGRAPILEQEPKEESSEEAPREMGETGELYKAVGTLKEIKESLQSEMPDIKLNFSAVVRKGEEISNRENSFIQIEEYLKTLDTQITELKKQREEAKLETPEGKHEALLKIDKPEDTVRSVDFKNIDHFYFKSGVMDLSEKIGGDTVKEVYTEALDKKLTSIAWDNKRRRGNGGWDNSKSDEQQAIEAYSALKKLNDFGYNYNDLHKFKELYNETLRHLEKIFQQSEKARDNIVQYRLPLSREDAEKREERGWSKEYTYADLYIQHMEEMLHITPHKILLDTLNSRKDISDRNVYSPEFIHAEFEKYNKFLSYIKNNTGPETKFAIDSYGGDDNTNLIFRAQNDKEMRQEMGLNEKSSEKYLEYPDQFINRKGGFDNAYSEASKVGKEWEKDKNQIALISTAAVESRFAQEWSRYFSEKNKDFLGKVDYDKNLIDQIEHSLVRLEAGLFKDPEFVGRKIKLTKSRGGYSDSIIEDISANEEYNQYRKEWDIIKQEMDEYANNKKTEIEKALGSLKRQIIAFGRDGKIEALNSKWQIFEDFKNDRLLNDERLKKYDISNEEIAAMKEYRRKRNDNDAQHKKDDAVRIKFLHASESKNFSLNFKPGVDILDGQEMTIEELPGRLEARLAELKNELANLSESELAIVHERDRSVEAVKASTDKFQKIAVENSDVIRKNYK